MTTSNVVSDAEYVPPQDVLPVADTRVGQRATAAAERGSRLFGDVAGLLAGELPDPPRPVVLTRNDGNAIFYPGQVNTLFGQAEAGKTMVCGAAIEEALKVGGRAVFVDIDHNGMVGTVTRLLDLGCPTEALSDPERFRYVEPQDKTELLDLVAFLRQWRPQLVVVDSVGELLPMFRLSSNNPDDFTTVHAEVLKPLAVAGACVITVDHVAKNTASADTGPTGTNAKRRAVGGVSVRVKVDQQFVPGIGGAVWLLVNKDRHGGLRQHCPTGDREPSAGRFTLTPRPGGGMVWNIEAPKAGDAQRISDVPAADVAALDQLDPPPSTVRDVAHRLEWQFKRAGDALRQWRVARCPATPEQQETPDQGVLPVADPVCGQRATAEPDPPEPPTPSCPTHPDEVIGRSGKCLGCISDHSAAVVAEIGAKKKADKAEVRRLAKAGTS